LPLSCTTTSSETAVRRSALRLTDRLAHQGHAADVLLRLEADFPSLHPGTARRGHSLDLKIHIGDHRARLRLPRELPVSEKARVLQCIPGPDPRRVPGQACANDTAEKSQDRTSAHAAPARAPARAAVCTSIHDCGVAR
jgi:hypothetical protein